MKITIKELNEAPNFQELKDKFGVGEDTMNPPSDGLNDIWQMIISVFKKKQSLIGANLNFAKKSIKTETRE